MMSFSLSGGVEVYGFIAPTDIIDTYPVIDPLYGIDGFRNVNNITDLNSIPFPRRRAGMVVGLSGGTSYYKLNIEPWNGTITDWSQINLGNGTSIGINEGGGNEVFKNINFDTIYFRTLSGGTNTTISTIGDLIIIDVTIPPDTNTFITGGTYNQVSEVLTLNRNDGVSIDVTGITGTFVTGNTYVSSTNDNNQTKFNLLYNVTPNGGPFFLNGQDTFTTGGTYDNNTALITFDRNDGQKYTIDLSTIDVNDTYVTGGTNNSSTYTSPNATIDLIYNRDVSPNTYFLPYTDVFVTGFTNLNNTFTIYDNSGNTYNTTLNTLTGLTINGNLHVTGITTLNELVLNGDFDLIGNLNITDNTNQIGNFYLTGNTEQIGSFYLSGNSDCTLTIDGNICLDGDLDISGNTFMSGNFCMNNMNSTGQTGTNCLDTSLIPTGTTVINQFQLKSGVLAHLGDLATGEPNSRGYTFFENNTDLTSFVAVGTGVYTPVIGAPQTLPAFNNLFIVTTGATTATTNKLTYDYPPATGSTFTFLKFTASLSIEVAQNQDLTFQIQRTRGLSITNIPIGMSIRPTGSGANVVSFNGIAEAQHQDEFVLVVRNATGSGGSNSIRITDLSFSMFT